MTDTASPDLGVDFTIDFGDSFGGLKSLDDLIGTVQANAVREFQRIQAAVKEGTDMRAASAAFTTLGATAAHELKGVQQASSATTASLEQVTRDFRVLAREKRATEASAEGLIRVLEREAATLGKTKAEIRAAKVEQVALTAAQQGNTEVADRLLAASRKRQFAAEAVAEAEERAAQKAAAALAAQAQELRSAAHAHQMFEARVRSGVEAMRAEAAAVEEATRAQAAQVSAVNSLRSATDPFYASQERLKRELESAARLYRDGAIEQDEYARSSAELARQLEAVQRAQASQNAGMSDGRRGLGAGDLANIAAQLSDIGVSLAGGQNPFMVMIQQGSQLGGIMMQTGVSVGGMAKAVMGLFIISKPTAAAIAAMTAAETAHAGALNAASTAGARAAIATAELAVAEEAAARAGVHDAVAQHAVALARAEAAAAAEVATAANAQLATSQAATAAAATNAAASAARALAPWLAAVAPFAIGIGVAISSFALFDRAVSKGVDTKAMVDGLGLTQAEIKRLENTSVSSGDVIKATFQVLAERVGFSMSATKKFFGDAMDFMTRIGADALAGIYAGFAGTFDSIVIIAAKLKTGNFTGTAGDIGKAFASRFKEGRAELTRFSADVTTAIGKNKLADLRKQAAEMNAGDKPKTDRHADQLAREATAVEAQIRNLYKLADAYGVSGAAALIAEARVKAETDAIKKRGDIEASVDRQVRLSIAQRVADSAKTSATMRDQAVIQTEVNALIAAGLVPSERAAELVQQRIAELPLLAAIEAAQQRGLTTEATKATAALEAQRDAQSRAKAAATGLFFTSAEKDAERQLAILREELRLVGATDETRVRAMATIRATQELKARGETLGTPYADKYIADQVKIADATDAVAKAQQRLNDELAFTADRWDQIAANIQNAAGGMADAFGEAGRAIGDLATIYASYHADRAKLDQEHKAAIKEAGDNEAAQDRANARFALASTTAEIGALGDAAAAAKGLFGEKTKGYAAVAAAEKAFRAIEFALSVRAMAQDVIETGSKIAGSAGRAAASAVEAVAKAIASLPFPANLAAGAATVAALASIGLSIAGSFGGTSRETPTNTGTGTVLGDTSAQSDSIKRAIDALKEVDTLTSSYARAMSVSLRSIDNQIGNVAALVTRSGNIDASSGVNEGFKTNAIGSVLKALVPVFGGALASLFGTKTSVVGSGLYGGPQSVGSILSGGFDASYYSDVEKTKKFLGITTGKSTSTQYTGADAGLEQQFTLILKEFNTAIAAAAGPLGQATDAVQARLNGFVVDIGRIDLKGLTGEQIQEKLSAVFGAAADRMADAAFPGIARFQKVGEGAFETLVRVASTVEAVTASLDQLGLSTRALGIDAKLGLADQFDSVGDMSSAVDAYFTTFYSKQEQAAAKAAQFDTAFANMGLTVPATLASFRALVEAQDLSTAAGQAAYATLIQLAPAFADLKASMDGAKSAADILSERNDLERKLLELNGDTAAIRALDLAKLDASNRMLQQQVWAVQDAQEAAKAADALREAWTSVGDTIMDEVKRIRGLTGGDAGGGFATLMGEFNAATAMARGGDQDAAKSLPGLSQALLKAAEDAATSRQELARVQAQTAASLEATYGAIGAMTVGPAMSTAASAIVASSSLSQAASSPAAVNDHLASEIQSLREEVVGLRRDNNSGHAATAGNVGRVDKRLEAVTADSGGTAITVASAA